MNLSAGGILCSLVLLCCSVAGAADNGKIWKPEIPKVWDDAALADWITPVACLNIRRAHISTEEYYAMPEYNAVVLGLSARREPTGYSALSTSARCGSSTASAAATPAATAPAESTSAPPLVVQRIEAYTQSFQPSSTIARIGRKG